jgi:hypothetical protein
MLLQQYCSAGHENVTFQQSDRMKQPIAIVATFALIAMPFP